MRIDNTQPSLFAAMLKRGRVSEKMAQDIAEAGSQIKLGKNDPQCDWKAVLKQFRQDGKIEDQLVGQVEDFTVAVDTRHKELAKKAKADKATASELRQLGDLELYQQRVEKLTSIYKEVTAQSAVAAVAGASFGPLSTIGAYLAWNPAPKKDVKELVDLMQHLDKGDSPLLLPGNQVTPVHQEKLWKTMVNLLEEATTSAKAGHPVEIDVQYFEMTSSSFIGKLAEAAQAGCPVRINIDPSRPGPGGLSDLSVDDGPRKMRGLLQMSALKDANVAISIFPVARELGGLEELMHRKLLRVGDKVLLGGMNANEGSGENFDTGYLIEGPAARRLVEGFQKDIQTSTGVTPDDVYGAGKVTAFHDGKVSLSPHGLATTFDALTGPSPAGVRIPAKPSLDQLKTGAEKLGVQLDDLIAISVDELEGHLKHGSRQPIELTEAGKGLLSGLVARTFAAADDSHNLDRLTHIDPPQGLVKGSVPVAIGSVSEEREALLLHAISSAEKFIYAPTFVITRAVARAMVARRDELAAQGKELDVRVVADAGVYPFGGTPNEEGVMALEDAGIPVRWSLLTRAEGDHDRKIHAKQILTEKMELVGSTNLSNKGIRDNWELGGLVYFQDPAPREDGVQRFTKLWEHEAIAMDSRQAAARMTGETGEVAIENARPKAIRTLLGMIQNYEVQTGKFIQEKSTDPQVAARTTELLNSGMAFGYARLVATEEVMGSEAFYAALKALPARQKLDDFVQ